MWFSLNLTINTILRGCGCGRRSGNIIADFTYDNGMGIILVFNLDAAVEKSVVSSSQASKILDFSFQAEGVRVELTVVGIDNSCFSEMAINFV